MATATTQLQLNFAERAVTRRPITLVIGLLSAVVGFIVLFVGNVIAVNALSTQIVETQSALQRISDENQQLHADIFRLSSFERITAAASGLGLVRSQAAPITLSPDSQR